MAHGIPVIDAQLDEAPLRCAVDSGARLSCLFENVADNHKSTGVERDFYPGLGFFDTDFFELEGSVNGYNFPVKFGRLPLAINGTMSAIDANAILGFDFFNRFQVYLDQANGVLNFR